MPDKNGVVAPVRVVIADDDLGMRHLIRAVLKQATDPEIEVLGEAANGNEAIQACELSHPDILILDHNMPALTGGEAIPRIREVSPRTRIIMHADLQGETVEGADAIVAKTNTSAMVDLLPRIRAITLAREASS
jgi:DNA-binding NarL/FixJ family response regulator